MKADAPTSAIDLRPQASMPWLVVAGASGIDGFQQLVDFVGNLPAEIPAAVLVVLHRPADQLSRLPGILARVSRIPIVIPKKGQSLVPGSCYVADADHHLSVDASGSVRLVPDHGYRGRTIDLLFESAAQAAGARVVGAVLAGSLRDGSAGLLAIERAGGVSLIIDSVWSQREGMPRAHLAVPQAQLAASSATLASAAAAAVSHGHASEHGH